MSADFRWEAVEPAGQVYSYTIVRRPFIEGSQASLPFAVVLLQFDAAPGVTLITNLADEDQADRLWIDAPSSVVFRNVGGGTHMPYAVLS